MTSLLRHKKFTWWQMVNIEWPDFKGRYAYMLPIYSPSLRPCSYRTRFVPRPYTQNI